MRHSAFFVWLILATWIVWLVGFGLNEYMDLKSKYHNERAHLQYQSE